MQRPGRNIWKRVSRGLEVTCMLHATTWNAASWIWPQFSRIATERQDAVKHAELEQKENMTKAHHIHSMNAGRYLVLLVLTLGSTFGDVFLSRGMRQIGEITISHWHDLRFAATNPWIILGTLLLLVFFTSYLSALSWADLSYIMPITAFGNVLTALLARFMLHEHIPFTRWAGILLITLGVGFITGSPSLTVSHAPSSGPENKPEESVRP
jgi:uncharacterized membrane protein